MDRGGLSRRGGAFKKVQGVHRILPTLSGQASLAHPAIDRRNNMGIYCREI
jgi:hypothetical protein